MPAGKPDQWRKPGNGRLWLFSFWPGLRRPFIRAGAPPGVASTRGSVAGTHPADASRRLQRFYGQAAGISWIRGRPPLASTTSMAVRPGLQTVNVPICSAPLASRVWPNGVYDTYAATGLLPVTLIRAPAGVSTCTIG